MSVLKHKSEIKTKIKELAADLGFIQCGIAKLHKLEIETNIFHDWLNKGMHGEMQYLENYKDIREDPALLVENAKSIIVFLYNYSPSENSRLSSTYKISTYALGKDYHFVIKEKLNQVMGSESRIRVDRKKQLSN